MKAIVFDFDGVIADTYHFSMGITKEVGHDVSHEDFKAHHDGNVLEQPHIQFTEASGNNFFQKYLERVIQVAPSFSSSEIKRLRNLCPLYIISSTRQKAIQKFLEHNALDYFDEILGGDFHSSKVEKFKYLFEKYHLQPKDVVFVTDTLGDILEANKVDVTTIAVDFGFHERERLEKGNPFKIVSSVDELLTVIREL